MDKRNWYTGQVVQESHLDEAFDNVESSIRATFQDAGIQGITGGLGVTAGGGAKQVVLATGVAYDTFGRRIYINSEQTLTLTTDTDGAPISNPGGSNVRWVSVFVKFELDESTPAVDGAGTEILTRTSEGFTVVVKQAVEGPLISASRPSAEADEVRCADVKLITSTTTFVDGDIDLDTADLAFTATREDDTTLGGKTLDAALSTIYQDLASATAGVATVVDAIDTRLDTAESTLADITSDLANLPAPGASSDFPRRDSDLSTVRSVDYDNLKAYLDTIEYWPRIVRKLTTVVTGATLDGATLTTNEYITQLPILATADVGSVKPTDTLPCLICSLRLNHGRYLRFYTHRYGFMITYNCYIINPDATLNWTRDATGSGHDYSSWAFLSGTLDPFSSSITLSKYKQEYDQDDTWDFYSVGSGGWQAAASIE